MNGQWRLPRPPGTPVLSEDAERARAEPPHRVGTWPNAITLARLGAAPGVGLLIVEERMHAALGLFVLAGLSDGLDGWLARHHGSASALGGVLDPVADKVLLAVVYLALAGCGLVEAWLAAVVLGRDLLLLGGAVLALRAAPGSIGPLPIGKLSTMAQFGFAGLVLIRSGFELGSAELEAWLGFGVAGLAVASGVAYLRRGAAGRCPSEERPGGAGRAGRRLDGPALHRRGLGTRGQP